VSANVTSIRLASLQAKTTYQFRVRAANAAGFSGYSNTVQLTTPGTTPTPPPPPPPPPSTPPAAPTALTIRWLGGGSVQLTWKDNSNNEVRFDVERMYNNGTWLPGATVGANVTTATVNGLQTHAAYTFRVKATNAAGQVTIGPMANINTF